MIAMTDEERDNVRAAINVLEDLDLEDFDDALDVECALGVLRPLIE